MRAKVAKILLVFALCFYIFKWLFFWLFETTDSYFYWEFGEFIRTGKYFAPHPYYWTIPTTFTAPLYSIFLYLIQFTPRADIFIHLFQITAVLFSGLLLFAILKKYIDKNWALIIASVYVLIPNHIFQSSSLMGESFALFAVSFFLFISFLILEKRKLYLMKYVVLFSAISIFIRYNFLILFILSLMLYCIHLVKGRKRFKQALGFSDLFYLLLSFILIGSWILINHQLTGSWGLSDQMGKNLYNRAIWGDRLIPPQNDPNWLKLKEMTNGEIDLFQPTYNIEPFILSNFDGKVARESEFFATIAYAAIKKNPIAYLQNTLVNFIRVHGNGLVYPKNLYTYDWLGIHCRSLGTISFCTSIIPASFAAPFWNTLVKWSDAYYYTFPLFINWIFLFPALFFAFFSKNTFVAFTSLTYITAVFTALLAEVPVFRYLYPLYGAKTVLIVYFLHRMIRIIKSYLLKKTI